MTDKKMSGDDLLMLANYYETRLANEKNPGTRNRWFTQIKSLITKYADAEEEIRKLKAIKQILQSRKAIKVSREKDLGLFNSAFYSLISRETMHTTRLKMPL